MSARPTTNPGPLILSLINLPTPGEHMGSPLQVTRHPGMRFNWRLRCPVYVEDYTVIQLQDLIDSTMGARYRGGLYRGINNEEIHND